MDKQLFEIIIIDKYGNPDSWEIWEYSYNNAKLFAFDCADLYHNNEYDEIIINEIPKEERKKQAWERENKTFFPA